METVLGLSKPEKLPMTILEHPIRITVEKLIVIDWEDPNALYRDYFPAILNARYGTVPDKDYIIAFKLKFKNEKPAQGMYIFDSHIMSGLQYDPVGIVKETENVKNVPIVRLEKEFEETYWFLMGISKEEADSFRARNALVISLETDKGKSIWFNSL